MLFFLPELQRLASKACLEAMFVVSLVVEND